MGLAPILTKIGQRVIFSKQAHERGKAHFTALAEGETGMTCRGTLC
jgi:hypothetical protein